MKKYTEFIKEEYDNQKDKLTDDQWVELSRKTVKYVHDGLRLGQSYMNALSEIDKDLYNEITNTDNDPFYSDNLVNFIKFLTN